MSFLYIDCRHGISGDMFLAGLAGLGADIAPFAAMLKDAGLIAHLRAETIQREGFAGHHLIIEETAEQQPLRHLEDILNIARALPLSDRVWFMARRAFMRLAEAEAAVHGMAREEVHFHEVGAVDTLVDVLGAAFCLEQLGVERVFSSPLPWFSGTVSIAHGETPLPAPATLELMQGKPVFSTNYDWEIITPTGALILDCLDVTFMDGPQGFLKRKSVSFGGNPAGQGLRLFLLDAQGQEKLDQVWVLESHVDHLSGEELGAAMDAIFAAGAVDVIQMPAHMKKNRPGIVLRALCLPTDLERVRAAFFIHTHTLGIRQRLEDRVCLPRRPAGLETPDGLLPAKAYDLAGRTFTRAEHDARLALARNKGKSLLEIPDRENLV